MTTPPPCRRTARSRYAAALFSLAALCFGAVVHAQDAYPSHPIRIVVGYPPGQTVDVTARAYAASMAKTLKQSVYVDNKPGANGILGAQTVAQAAPDGYTVLFGTSGQLAINPAVYRKLSYDPVHGMTPLGLGALGRLYLVVPVDSPYRTLGQLFDDIRAHPGKLSYGSGGIGITAHLAMEMLKHEAALDIVHVPYKGSPAALNDLLGGRVQVMMDAGNLLLPQIRNGKLRALAVSSGKRYTELPDVPTLAEAAVPGFEVGSWSAVMGPPGMPPEIVRKIDDALVQAAQDPDVIRIVRAAGSEPTPMASADFARFLQAETQRWARAVRDAGISEQ
ncbi:Bug family tripartite tricarboxylate transporter substrate binding protein [Achromobacter aloeverae]|nr:tripartite tricarboxylate transporter substrate binding protein [Achromobacter aloeverae]